MKEVAKRPARTGQIANTMNKTFNKTNSSIALSERQYRITIPAPWNRGKTLTVGVVKGDTFTKTVLDKHILHSPPAHSLDENVIERLKEQGVKYVEIKHKTKPIIWATALSSFMSSEKSFGLSRANAGRQRAVYMQYWLVNGSNPVAAKKKSEEPVSVQNSISGASYAQQRMVM